MIPDDLFKPESHSRTKQESDLHPLPMVTKHIRIRDANMILDECGDTAKSKKDKMQIRGYFFITIHTSTIILEIRTDSHKCQNP